MFHSKDIHIVFFIESLAAGLGGAEKILLNVANEMFTRGFAVDIFYLVFNNITKPAYDTKFDNKNLHAYSSLDDIVYAIKKLNPTVLMVFYYNRYIPVFFISHFSDKIPVCIQECSNPKRIIREKWLKNKVILPLYRAVWERNILASHAVRIRLVMPNYERSFEKYIHNTIRAFTNPCPKNQSINNIKTNERYIIIVNGFKKNKFFILLLKAFGLLADLFPKWNIIMVGKVNVGRSLSYVDEIYKFIESKKLKDRVVLHGTTNDILRLFSQCHIHVISSLSEGCPTVVLEAMSVGVPSIGYEDCEGTNQLIRHGVNGLLARSDDRVQGLAEALQRLMSNEELRMQLGRQAKEDAKKYSPDVIYDQWEQLFLEAAEYRHDPGRLLREQMRDDPEAALHARRMLPLLSL